MSDEFFVVSAYFNPLGYGTRLENYRRFIAGLESVGVSFRVVECALGGAPFELPNDTPYIRVRSRDIMWQKERLLNVALRALPAICTKVAWLDCDVLFENERWVEEASRALDLYPVVQVFDTAVRLPRGQIVCSGGEEIFPSFGAVYNACSKHVISGDFARHGYTGFGWAARRNWLDECGLYDVCVVGGGDHLMAHAFAGDVRSPCLDHTFGSVTTLRRHFESWAKVVGDCVRGQIGVVGGRLLHLWHGDIADRRYFARSRDFQLFGFDPYVDLRLGKEGAWEWASSKTAMHNWIVQYFRQRCEDGPRETTG